MSAEPGKSLNLTPLEETGQSAKAQPAESATLVSPPPEEGKKPHQDMAEPASKQLSVEGKQVKPHADGGGAFF